MPNEKQDLINHRKVAQACKDYTDKEIKKVYYNIGHNDITTDDHTDEATYRFTAPLNSKLLMLQSIAGNSVKYSPSVASDNNATHIKTLPSTVYDLDVSKVEGVGYKVNQVLGTYSETYSQNGMSIVASNGSWTLSGTATGGNFNYVRWLSGFNTSHKYLVMISGFSGTSSTKFVQLFSTMLTNNGMIVTPTATGGNIQYYCYDGNGDNKTYYPNIFDLTTDFGSGNEPTSVSDCATEYAKRGIDIYSYTQQQSSIKNNAFTGATVEGTNHFDINTIYSDTTKFTISGSKVTSSSAMFFYTTRRYFKQNEIGKTFTFKVLFTSNCIGTGFRVGGRINNADVNGNFPSTFPNYSSITVTPTSTNDFLRIDFSDGSKVEIDEVMLNEGSSAIDYIPYTSQTIPIDLTTIKDSNNVSLFPSGKLMGTNNADFITPYNQESRWNERTYSSSDVTEFATTYENVKFFSIPQPSDYKFYGEWGNNPYFISSKFEINTGTIDSVDTIGKIVWNTSRLSWQIGFALGTTLAQAQSAIDGLVIQYERKTYLTSNTDLTSLTKINAQSNGTITLNNTDNVDMPNLISYNGVIKHALATAVKYESFNVWDEEWEVGKYGSDGQKIAGSSNTIRSKNLIPVLPNTTYYIKCSQMGYLYGYDVNGDFISNFTDKQNATFTTPANCYFLAFWVASPYGTTYLNDICINISGTLNGTYKPHKPTYTRALTNNEEKYSWGITTGVRNVRTYCDDEGNAVNEGSLDVILSKLKDLNWDTNYGAFFTYISDQKYIQDVINFLCNVYTEVAYTGSMTTFLNSGDKIITITSSAIWVKDSLFTNKTIFKNHFTNDDDLYYPLKNTDTETLDDFDYFFDCEEGDTFTLVNTENLQCYATYSFLIKEARTNE